MNNEAPTNYMDLSVAIQEQCLSFELFRKPSDSGVNLSFTSNIPMQVKLAVATEQFRRADRLSSSEEARERSRGKIKDLLQKNGFPAHVVEETMCQSEKRKPTAKDRHCTLRNRNCVYVKLPFVSDEVQRRTCTILKRYGLPIKVVNLQGRSLKDRLIRSALTPKTCPVREEFQRQQNATKRSRGKPRDDCISCLAGLDPSKCSQLNTVYALQCSFCGEEYIGETRRSVRKRLGEHHLQARNRTAKTPWGSI